MGDNTNPTMELLLEKITNLENENNSLREENSKLNSKIDEVINFNRTLLNKPATKVATGSATDEKLKKFIEGE